MEREKSVDESWKESASQEKERLESLMNAGEAKKSSGQARPDKEQGAVSSPGAEDDQSHAGREGDFLNYITTLGYQAMVFLGEIPNPATNVSEKNLEQAKFVIDTLILLQEKTKGNLTKKESDVLNTAAYELQMRYVDLAQKEGIA